VSSKPRSDRVITDLAPNTAVFPLSMNFSKKVYIIAGIVDNAALPLNFGLGSRNITRLTPEE
jgi:hypothetical protein